MNAIIGYTSPLGMCIAENLQSEAQTRHYNNNNLNDILNDTFDTVYCIPDGFTDNIANLMEVLAGCNANQVVLISSLNIYKDSYNSIHDEDSQDINRMHSHYLVEELVRNKFDHYYILRVAPLVGENSNQLYYPEDIVKHIQIAISNNLRILNLCSEPINAAESPRYTTRYSHIFLSQFCQSSEFINSKLAANTEDASISRLVISDRFIDESKLDLYLLLLQKHGITKIELNMHKYFKDWYDINTLKLESLKEKFQQFNISIHAITNIFKNRPENMFTTTNSFLNHFIKMMQYANAVGAKKIIFGTPQTRYIPASMNIQQAHVSFMESMEALGLFSKNYNVSICIEAIPGQYGCNYLTTNEMLQKIVTAIDKPGQISACLNIDHAILTSEAIVLTDTTSYLKLTPSSYQHMTKTALDKYNGDICLAPDKDPQNFFEVSQNLKRFKSYTY